MLLEMPTQLDTCEQDYELTYLRNIGQWLRPRVTSGFRKFADGPSKSST